MTPLAVVIAMYCSHAVAGPADANAAAAPNDPVQEIVVTGLRQSLVTSETIKRDSAARRSMPPQRHRANSPTRSSLNRFSAYLVSPSVGSTTKVPKSPSAASGPSSTW